MSEEAARSTRVGGCHVCSGHHGTAHYFNICAPKHRYAQEMADRADEMRALATISTTAQEPRT